MVGGSGGNRHHCGDLREVTMTMPTVAPSTLGHLLISVGAIAHANWLDAERIYRSRTGASKRHPSGCGRQS